MGFFEQMLMNNLKRQQQGEKISSRQELDRESITRGFAALNSYARAYADLQRSAPPIEKAAGNLQSNLGSIFGQGGNNGQGLLTGGVEQFLTGPSRSNDAYSTFKSAQRDAAEVLYRFKSGSTRVPSKEFLDQEISNMGNEYDDPVTFMKRMHQKIATSAASQEATALKLPKDIDIDRYTANMFNNLVDTGDFSEKDFNQYLKEVQKPRKSMPNPQFGSPAKEYNTTPTTPDSVDSQSEEQ